MEVLKSQQFCNTFHANCIINWTNKMVSALQYKMNVKNITQFSDHKSIINSQRVCLQ